MIIDGVEMHSPEAVETTTVRRGWFCVRSHPKHEHIAAAHLAQIPGVEVFLPRVKVRRKTRTGSALFTESLFPGYVFTRFHLDLLLSEVRHTRSVSHVVHFGHRWPAIPDDVMSRLKVECADLEGQEDRSLPVNGEHVEIAEGAFMGLSAEVLRVLPAAHRVVVLMEFLGRTTPLELDLNAIVSQERSSLLSGRC